MGHGQGLAALKQSTCPTQQGRTTGESDVSNRWALELRSDPYQTKRMPDPMPKCRTSCKVTARSPTGFADLAR